MMCKIWSKTFMLQLLLGRWVSTLAHAYLNHTKYHVSVGAAFITHDTITNHCISTTFLWGAYPYTIIIDEERANSKEGYWILVSLSSKLFHIFCYVMVKPKYISYWLHNLFFYMVTYSICNYAFDIYVYVCITKALLSQHLSFDILFLTQTFPGSVPKIIKMYLYSETWIFNLMALLLSFKNIFLFLLQKLISYA